MLRASLRGRVVEIRRRLDEHRHGPLGESRSAEVTRRVDLVDLSLVRDDDPRFKNLRLHLDEESLQELQDSLSSEGMRQPITVLESPPPSPALYLRAGFRRTIAARRLGWKKIPAIILPHDTPEIDGYWTNIIENAGGRAKLSSYEIACAAKTMRDKFGVQAATFARKAGYSPSYVGNLLRCIDNLPEEILEVWEGRAPIPTDMYVKWATLTPDEAVQHLRSYTARYPKIVADWRPPERPSGKKTHPVRMATSGGLARMQRLRFAVEVARSISAESRDLCLQVIDYCSGARESVDQVYDARTKQRSYKSRRREDRAQDPPMPDPDDPNDASATPPEAARPLPDIEKD